MNENREIYFGENPSDEDVKRLREAFEANPAEIEERIKKLDEALLAEKEKSVAERLAAFKKEGASS